MSVQFIPEEKKNPQKPGEKPLFYIRPKARGFITLRELLHSVCDDSTIDEEEVLLAIRRMFKKLLVFLDMGFNVHLDDLGYFAVCVKSKGAETANELTADNATNIRIVFYPGRPLRISSNKIRLEKIKKED